MSTRLRSSTRASTAASESLAGTMAEVTKTKSETSRKSAANSSNRLIRGSEMARLKRIAGVAYVVANLCIFAVYYMAMNDMIKLYPNSIKIESLKGFNSRAEYALRYQTILYSWIVFNVLAVIYSRLSNMALNPLVDSTEKHVLLIKNVLTNSFEQIVLSSFLQLAFVSFADHSYTLKLIPAVNIVQFIGRVAFLAGYPLYRTFGITLTITPNLLMLCYNMYKLGSYLGLY